MPDGLEFQLRTIATSQFNGRFRIVISGRATDGAVKETGEKKEPACYKQQQKMTVRQKNNKWMANLMHKTKRYRKILHRRWINQRISKKDAVHQKDVRRG